MRRWQLTRALPLLILSGLLGSSGLWSSVPAAETPSAAQSTTVAEVPAVFSKPLPESVDDLRAMEAHIRDLVPKITECTVGVQIGPAQGSGVIVTADGYVLTAAHVSGTPGRKAEIILPNGTRVSATTLGRDDTLDAGLVKLNSGTDWPHAEMAPADSIEAGEWCLAAGHPGGFHADRPPVFRLGRVIFATSRVVQTDCELVGGDSGGPLFDMQGRVIGINSRIGEGMELNFHSPIGAYSRQWKRLVNSESFRSHSGALLGVSGKPHLQGLEITTVYPGDPAEEAGVKVGDVLVALESHKIRSIKQLVELVGRYPPGRTVELELLRDGKPMELEVRLGFRFD